MNRLIVAALSVAIATSSAVAAWACSCAPYESAAAHLADAEAAFSGRVVSTSSGQMGVVTTFRVQSRIKGRMGATVRVRHGTSSASCGIVFQRGRSYLVVANAGAEGLSTNLCFAPRFPEAAYRAAAGSRS